MRSCRPALLARRIDRQSLAEQIVELVAAGRASIDPAKEFEQRPGQGWDCDEKPFRIASRDWS